MKDIYKKLMKQHGGSIPFTVLGGVKQKKKTVRKPKKKRRRRAKTTRIGHIVNSNKYSPGTLIRRKGTLWTLTKSKKWIPIKDS